MRSTQPARGLLPHLRTLGKILAMLAVWMTVADTATALTSEAEPNNNPASANLIPFSGNHGSVDVAKIGSLSDVDYYKVVMPTFVGVGNLTITMTPTSSDHELDAVLSWEDSAGDTIQSSDTGSDNVPETIYATVGSGQTCYIRCSTADILFLGSGDYRLSLSLNVTNNLSGVVQRPGDLTSLPVGIVRYDANASPINPNVRTWLVIHGWNSSSSADNIAAVAMGLAADEPGDQVLALDWSSLADTGILDPFDAESAIVPVARWAATVLTSYGFNGTNLNLVGHSFGSYVSDEIAQRISGGVNTIVTLDPAVDVIGGYSPSSNDEVDFARDSDFSWSFHASDFGSDETPLTADESFIVDAPDADPISAHSDVVSLFAFLLDNPTNIISQYFSLNYLLSYALGPWLPNQYASPFISDDSTEGYEAEIIDDATGKVPADLEYVPIAPDAPTANPVSSSTSTSFVASWNNVRGATGYRLDVSTNGGFSDFVVGLQNYDLGDQTSGNVVGLTPGGTYFYRVRAYDSAGSSSNSVARSVTLTVSSPAINPPNILVPPESQGAKVGTTVTFAVVGSGDGTLTYQWQKNGKDLPGATLPILTLLKVSAADAGAYSVTITNANGSVKTAPVSLSVAKNAPKISIQPTAVKVKKGGTAKFTVKATGDASLSYQWKKGAVSLVNGGTISGANTAKLKIAKVKSADAGKYLVVVSNPAGKATSASVKLTVK